MKKNKIYILLGLLTFSGFSYAQTSPFSKETTEIRNSEYIKKDDFNESIDDLRMQISRMERDIMRFEMPKPPSSEDFDGPLEDGEEIKMIINGKKLKRDSETYSLK